MSEHAVNRLEVNEIAALAERIFSSREVTFQGIAEEFPLATLSSSLLGLFESAAEVVKHLPDAAFGPQSDDIDGSDVWSAGQIVSHLAEMEIQTLHFWEVVSGTKFPDPPQPLIEALGRPPATMHACVACLELMHTQNAHILGCVARACSGEEKAMHPALGLTSVRAAILGNCIHLVDHHLQLRGLCRPSIRIRDTFVGP